MPQDKEAIETFSIRESRARSLVKSIIYRIISFIGTAILSWIITRDIGKTLTITLSIQIFLIILYYVYERIWNNIDWGREIQIK